MHTPVRNGTNNRVTTPKSLTKKGNAEHRVQSSLSPLKRGKKNTISNLTPRTKPFAQKTHKHFCVKLAVEDAYPKSEDLAKMVLDSFKKGLDGHDNQEEFVKQYKTEPAYSALLVDVVSSITTTIKYSC